MFRKLTVLLLTLLVLFCFTLSTSAQEYSRVVDDVHLLQAAEISLLEETSAEITEYYGIDAVIVITDSLMGQSAQNYADDFYDNAGYAEDGVLFLLAVEDREWYISTSGSMIYSLTDYGIQQLGEHVVTYFSDGLWFDGFHAFLISLPDYLEAYEQGTPIDGNADYSGSYYHADQEDILYYEENSSPSFVLSLICGIVVAGIVILIMRASMNTKRAQNSASEYINDGSWQITQHHDLFLYSRVTKTEKPQNNSSSGGSSVHRSSGGRSHGGGGGKF